MIRRLGDLEISELSGALSVTQELEGLARGGALLDLLFIYKDRVTKEKKSLRT